MDGYAVVDVETTGLSPARHDRIAEIAVVRTDRAGAIVDEWCTLVNPGRDMGPQRIHGIRAAQARRAPAFAEIAGAVGERLRGRVIAAHNLAFDADFIAAEFDRVGVVAPVRDGVCTMTAAPLYLPSPSRSLASCCRVAGIDIGRAHSALDDARACARLLARFLDSGAEFPVEPGGWPEVPEATRAALTRDAPVVQSHFLARLVDRLPRVSEPARADEYLALLDRALLDRYVSLDEQESLTALAHSLDLSAADARRLHETYLAAIAKAALSEGEIGSAERNDLREVAALLGLSEDSVDSALKSESRPVPLFRLVPGDVVVFTGEGTVERDDWHTRTVAAGLVPAPGVTKATRLVVAADADSQSGKAEKARRYGIPVISESAYAALLAEVAKKT
ncbi:exonuclease domain-containing protein [Actinokineospora sp. NBRC 105648]|uniref:exonuclease domain-containing protein n=1 Tax=Actinokineospora sp. NBRC 105648 TaxID=3032206 RepID=UPI002552BBCA|nr:exonuclease domain-containing protein [Actinokineospora sp. NBRC 105648]